MCIRFSFSFSLWCSIFVCKYILWYYPGKTLLFNGKKRKKKTVVNGRHQWDYENPIQQITNLNILWFLFAWNCHYCFWFVFCVLPMITGCVFFFFQENPVRPFRYKQKVRMGNVTQQYFYLQPRNGPFVCLEWKKISREGIVQIKSSLPSLPPTHVGQFRKSQRFCYKLKFIQVVFYRPYEDEQ